MLIWEDELFAGETTPLPSYYKVEDLLYDPQGPYPFCAATAVTTAAEYAYKRDTGITKRFSQAHLFFNGGGTKSGASATRLLNVARKNGMVLYGAMPMPELFEDNWCQILRKKALSIPFKDAYKIPGFLGVVPDKDKIKKAIFNYGPLIIGVYASFIDGYYTGNGKRKTQRDNHLVVLAGWDDVDNKWIIHESQNWAKNTEGYVTLHQDYTFNCVLGIPEGLPENWREIIDEKRKAPEGALEHYGQLRVWQKEKNAEQALIDAFSKFNNKSVSDAAGRFWPIYINAIAYGGYSVKDVVNDCYNWRRTGQNIFDFNYETRDQWAERIKGLR